MSIQIVETQTVHRMFYAVKSKVPLNNADCYQLLVNNQLEEMAQNYVGEQIISVSTFTPERFILECKKLGVDNPTILNLEIPTEADILDANEVSIMGDIPE